jgi:phosphatidylserine/phosphatidylglycerophosphate/cardiolipin synthase-like enzyme
MSSLTVNILRGDAKVFIACNLDKKDTKNLAGFTFFCEPGTETPYYIFNQLQFADPANHAQVALEPPRSSINSPIQKFRWLHVPGSLHQKDKVFYGLYKYTVTPRYFKDGRLLPIDKTLSVTVSTLVEPFRKGDIELGFTRGFVQSQAFGNRFGKDALLKPKANSLLYDTSQQAGTNSAGENFTFLDEYVWSGFTAREKIFQIVEQVIADKSLFLDVFAYDLNETDLLAHFLTLAGQGRMRIILDNATLHHDDKKLKPEDQFEQQFKIAESKQPGGTPAESGIIRGKFNRFQHNKILIISQGDTRTPVKLLTGSTNFSVTGMYVNSNHVVVFNDAKVVELYQRLFEAAWTKKANAKEFLTTDLPKQEFTFNAVGLPSMFITFAPHKKVQALANLNKITTRMAAEQSSVLFAVMATDPTSTGPVIPALKELQKRLDIFSAGITDSTDGLEFYKPSSKTGVLVTGKPNKTLLPPPFNKEAGIGLGHQIHHKFIVCGFNTPDAVVWLGSSNLAEGGEEANGDNLIEIRDRDIATAFAIEALALIDHFHFRDNHPAPKTPKKGEPAPLPPKKLAAFHLFTDAKWAKSYYKDGDLHQVDRELFMK